jgi:hypothetical protein
LEGRKNLRNIKTLKIKKAKKQLKFTLATPIVVGIFNLHCPKLLSLMATVDNKYDTDTDGFDIIGFEVEKVTKVKDEKGAWLGLAWLVE